MAKQPEVDYRVQVSIQSPRYQNRLVVALMLIIGVFGYLLRKLGFSLAPVILGYVLGGLMEQNLRRALSISGGDTGILWQSGISLGLWIAAAALLVQRFRLAGIPVYLLTGAALGPHALGILGEAREVEGLSHHDVVRVAATAPKESAKPGVR